MSEHSAFQVLIQRVRLGEDDAAAALVRQYEPAIRRFLTVRLLNSQYRHTIDPLDLCQSVLASLFVRLGVGQFDLQQPEQLQHLLLRMARNKLCDQMRRHGAAPRDRRRLVENGQDALAAVAAAGDSPSQEAVRHDLADAARRLMSNEERFLAEQRSLGRSWSDIAEQVGSNADAVRKKLERAVNRVARELGLDLADPEEHSAA